MIDRFEGPDGKARLAQQLSRQMLIGGDMEIAQEFANVAEVRTYPSGGLVIEQGAQDNDLHFILSGRVSVIVNYREVAVGTPGTHVGEMALIDPTVPRSAKVVAIGDVVVATVSEPDFTALARRYPQLWRSLAVELDTRLRKRNERLARPNPRPVLAFGASTDSAPATRAIQAGLAGDDFLVQTWADGIFTPSNYPLDDLITMVSLSDFAGFVFGPDDELFRPGNHAVGPRDNVVFLLGLAIGQLGRERTLVIAPQGADIKVSIDRLGLTPLTYAVGDGNLNVALAPVCDRLRSMVARLGCL